MTTSMHDALRSKFPEWRNAPFPASCSCPHPHPTCPFRALGMGGPVDRASAKSRYYDLCRTLHPDVSGPSKDARGHFHRVSEAWRLLELKPFYAPARTTFSSRPSCAFQYGVGALRGHPSSGSSARYGHVPPSPPLKPVHFLLNGTLIATVVVTLGIISTMQYCKEKYGAAVRTEDTSLSRALTTAPPLKDERAIGQHLRQTEERARREGAEQAMNRFREEARAYAALHPDRPSAGREERSANN
ncbi:MAG: hypothetical protein DHS80DRAFT_25658 [Piptocephalis tieghemiana]|nr:MAG: hypothetical protein DHS80DRAFT_25658 [Piptocephalis tieghemiana]